MSINTIKNIFTVDVEDYFQVESFSKIVDRKNWESFESRVERNTQKILEMLDEHNIKGTFFVLGWVARRNPGLVQEIARNGHEIASHGMSHRMIYTQSIDDFKQETLDSKHLLEDIVQTKVIGYRAATYSIVKESLWALDILVDAGYEYDSSIFPIKHDRYGIPDALPYPHILDTPSGQKIAEYPISTLKTRKFNLPIAGGGYFRLFPYWFTKFGLNKINRDGRDFVFYIHPWEVDPDQPRFNEAPRFSRFRHYNNLEKCEKRLSNLLTDFEFTTMKDVMRSKGLIENAA